MPAFAVLQNYSIEWWKRNIVLQADVCKFYSNLREDLSDIDWSRSLSQDDDWPPSYFYFVHSLYWKVLEYALFMFSRATFLQSNRLSNHDFTSSIDTSILPRNSDGVSNFSLRHVKAFPSSSHLALLWLNQYLHLSYNSSLTFAKLLARSVSDIAGKFQDFSILILHFEPMYVK
jgi:hypothetical protein